MSDVSSANPNQHGTAPPPQLTQPLTPVQQQELWAELQQRRALDAERQQQLQSAQAAAQREVDAVRRTAEAVANAATARATPAGPTAIKPPPMQSFHGKVGFEVDTWIRAWERQFTFPGVAVYYPPNQPKLRVEAAAAYLTGAPQTGGTTSMLTLNATQPLTGTDLSPHFVNASAPSSLPNSLVLVLPPSSRKDLSPPMLTSSSASWPPFKQKCIPMIRSTISVRA
jgi:hypothetical protein